MGMRDLFDNVSLHLALLLEKNRHQVQYKYRSFLTGPPAEFVIFRGRQSVMPKYPVIEIIRGPVETSWGSIRVLTERYNFFLDCSIKHASREVSQEFVTVFGRSVQVTLNSFMNLRFPIPGVMGVRAFDSLATGMDPGFRRSSGENTARVTWQCSVANLVSAPGSGGLIPA